MRLIQADYIFPVTVPPIKNGIIRLNDSDVILEIIDPAHTEFLQEPGTIQKLNGFICPGFINSHCHLELSHLKGKVEEKTGMTGFIKGLIAVRNKNSNKEVQEAILEAEKEMISGGIVAVGDISNTDDTFKQKSYNKLRYHTFIELFDLGAGHATETFNKGTMLRDELVKHMPANHSCSLVPHAPYTVSDKLFSLLNTCSYENNSLMTIHNQESAGEDQLFINKSGPLLEFFNQSGIDMTYITPTGFNSLQSTLIKLSKCNKTLLVHNTYTTEDDLLWAAKYSNILYWCFCANANLFIEDRIPDIKKFLKNNLRITLGTDSLASNNSLSILEEMKTILRLNPFLSLQDVMPWATINGADFFNFKNELGSLDNGKAPGINLIEHVDLLNVSLTEKSTVRRVA